jgi:hypothetical protein
VLRFAGGGLLSAKCGKFAAGSAKASNEAAEIRSFRGFLLGCSLFGHGSLTGEDELGDVSKSDGVAAGDPLASELPDEIAEEEIHFVGRGETVDIVEKLGGEDLGVDNGNGGAETFGVVSAERRAVPAVRDAMVLVDEHVAALAFRADVLALVIDGGIED